MAESFVQVAPDSTGKQLRTQTSVQAGNTVHEEVMVVADSIGNMVGTSANLQNAMQVALQDSSAVAFQRNSAANLTTATQTGGLVTAGPGQWNLNNAPAANTQATATRAAGGAGVRHVLQAVAGTISSGSGAVTVPATPVQLQVLDNATVIFTQFMSIPTTAGSSVQFSLSGLNIFGTANQPMIVQFSAAGGANSFESVFASGYDTV